MKGTRDAACGCAIEQKGIIGILKLFLRTLYRPEQTYVDDGVDGRVNKCLESIVAAGHNLIRMFTEESTSLESDGNFPISSVCISAVSVPAIPLAPLPSPQHPLAPDRGTEARKFAPLLPSPSLYTMCRRKSRNKLIGLSVP